MAAQRKTAFTALNVPVTTRDDLNRLALDLSAQLGRRVSMAAIVRAALAVAKAHPDELTATLGGETEAES